MHITLEADYAVRIVHALAQSGKRLDAKTISEMTGVTLRFSLKILRKLVAAGIVKSFKGTQGGYEIGKPAEEISLGEVIETIEGRYTLNRNMPAHATKTNAVSSRKSSARSRRMCASVCIPTTFLTLWKNNNSKKKNGFSIQEIIEKPFLL